jgi:hypothetical protein
MMDKIKAVEAVHIRKRDENQESISTHKTRCERARDAGVWITEKKIKN